MVTRQIMFLLVIAGLLSGCALNPVTGKNQLMLISPAQELQIGQQHAPQVEKQLGGRINNTIVQNYINQIGQRIARVSHMPTLKFHYVALNDKSVNAMALPGGYIFITRGMLEKLDSEAQLAGILAHETVHVTARHTGQAMSTQIGLDVLLSALSKQNTSQGVMTAANITTQLMGLRYSRAHETESDSVGVDYLIRAGYNPYAMVQTMRMLQEQNQRRPVELFSTHPNPAGREANLLNILAGRTGINNLKTGKEDYRRIVLSNLYREE